MEQEESKIAIDSQFTKYDAINKFTFHNYKS